MGVLVKRLKAQLKWRTIYLECDNSSDFSLSCWQKSYSCVPLLILRSFVFLLNLSILIASLIVTDQLNYIAYWPIYMTHWGLAVNFLATGFGVAVSALTFMYGPIDNTFGLPLYVKSYWVLVNISITTSFFITLFYFSFLVDVPELEGMDLVVDPVLDIFCHGINTAGMFIWLLSSRQESRLYHAAHPILFAVLYLMFNLIYYAAGGDNGYGETWIYPMLDWSNPGPTVVMVLLTTLMIIIVHIVVVAVATGRDALAKLYTGDANIMPVSE